MKKKEKRSGKVIKQKKKKVDFFYTWNREYDQQKKFSFFYFYLSTKVKLAGNCDKKRKLDFSFIPGTSNYDWNLRLKKKDLELAGNAIKKVPRIITKCVVSNMKKIMK
ncbi:hypothetical protein C2G38_2041702 [Gigaspora rosea]|uniref:Uncharacterized protein n=1 Tax=Gigaspora rosea TaxID=44941 RepID=A0A397UTB7_9GLOM|nr:hypothetical protein C2G38_2041702 [Gigaspora rosea]